MAAYHGDTGKLHEVELSSSIEQVAWTRRAAAPSGTVGLEVFTHFVGNGSDIQIELIDGEGRRHGSFKEQIAGNRVWAPIKVPPKARKALVATVKLPKHGLEMDSPALMLMPPVTIRNAEWSAEEARRGDVLTLSADVKGAPDGTAAQLTIWEHDADEAHDLITSISPLVEGERVEVEWEFEYHEDTDDIPTDEETEQGYQAPEYFFRLDVGGVQEESGLVRFKDWLELERRDIDGNPAAGERYVLHLADGSTREGTLDGDGRAREEGLPPGPVSYEYPDRESY